MAKAPKGKGKGKSARKQGASGQAKAKARKPRQDTISQKPTLQVFVICERSDQSQDGVHTLYRVVDRFNLRIEINAPEGADLPPIRVPISYVLFTRFGAGTGHFRTHAELFDPDEKSLAKTDENLFWLTGRETSHTLIGSISLPVEKGGPHRWVCYLDGEQVGEFIFTVNIEHRFVRTG